MMMSKISMAISALALVSAAVTGFLYFDSRRDVAALARQVDALETHAEDLSRQLASLAVNAPTGRRARFPVSDAPIAQDIVGPQTADAPPPASGDRPSLDADLRQEVASIVEAQQETAREKRRQEWESRMKEGLAQSLQEFAEDHRLDETTTAQVQTLLEGSMNRRAELRQDLESRNISFYEFRQENRRQEEEMQANLSKLLTREQIAAFVDAFPVGRGGPGPGPR
jgi:hypothetical protein